MHCEARCPQLECLHDAFSFYGMLPIWRDSERGEALKEAHPVQSRFRVSIALYCAVDEGFV